MASLFHHTFHSWIRFKCCYPYFYRRGAHGTNQIPSPCAEFSYAPFHYRRLNLTASLPVSSPSTSRPPIHCIVFNSTGYRPTHPKSFTIMCHFLDHSLSKDIQLHCRLPIFPTLPLLAMPPPNIIIKLCEVPTKCINESIYCSHFPLPESPLASPTDQKSVI